MTAERSRTHRTTISIVGDPTTSYLLRYCHRRRVFVSGVLRSQEYLVCLVGGSLNRRETYENNLRNNLHSLHRHSQYHLHRLTLSWVDLQAPRFFQQVLDLSPILHSGRAALSLRGYCNSTVRYFSGQSSLNRFLKATNCVSSFNFPFPVIAWCCLRSLSWSENKTQQRKNSRQCQDWNGRLKKCFVNLFRSQCNAYLSPEFRNRLNEWALLWEISLGNALDINFPCKWAIQSSLRKTVSEYRISFPSKQLHPFYAVPFDVLLLHSYFSHRPSVQFMRSCSLTFIQFQTYRSRGIDRNHGKGVRVLLSGKTWTCHGFEKRIYRLILSTGRFPVWFRFLASFTLIFYPFVGVLREASFAQCPVRDKCLFDVQDDDREHSGVCPQNLVHTAPVPHGRCGRDDNPIDCGILLGTRHSMASILGLGGSALSFAADLLVFPLHHGPPLRWGWLRNPWCHEVGRWLFRIGRHFRRPFWQFLFQVLMSSYLALFDFREGLQRIWFHLLALNHWVGGWNSSHLRCLLPVSFHLRRSMVPSANGAVHPSILPTTWSPTIITQSWSAHLLKKPYHAIFPMTVMLNNIIKFELVLLYSKTLCFLRDIESFPEKYKDTSLSLLIHIFINISTYLGARDDFPASYCCIWWLVNRCTFRKNWKFRRFWTIFPSKRASRWFGQIASEKVWGWASPRGLARGLNNITLCDLPILQWDKHKMIWLSVLPPAPLFHANPSFYALL